MRHNLKPFGLFSDCQVRIRYRVIYAQERYYILSIAAFQTCLICLHIQAVDRL